MFPFILLILKSRDNSQIKHSCIMDCILLFWYDLLCKDVKIFYLSFIVNYFINKVIQQGFLILLLNSVKNCRRGLSESEINFLKEVNINPTVTLIFILLQSVTQSCLKSIRKRSWCWVFFWFCYSFAIYTNFTVIHWKGGISPYPMSLFCKILTLMILKTEQRSAI